MELSELQVKKVSEYLLDISKLLFGSTFVAIFIPGASENNFDLAVFFVGLLLTVACFILGLKFLATIKNE